MALVKCPECGKEISDTAKSCPNCGYVFKKKGTSKTIIRFVAVVAAIIVAVFAICTIRYYNNPFKRIKANNNYYALVMSYGFPQEESNKYIWDNISFCGLKGKLIVMTDKKDIYVSWNYSDGLQLYSDNREKVFDAIRKLINDKNWNGGGWRSSDGKELLEYIDAESITMVFKD